MQIRAEICWWRSAAVRGWRGCSGYWAFVESYLSHYAMYAPNRLCSQSPNHCRRFVQKNLLVEITSNARLARLLSWALRKHIFICYTLYTAGARPTPRALDSADPAKKAGNG